MLQYKTAVRAANKDRKNISKTINQFATYSTVALTVLTNADGDVGRPLVVVLTGYCFLSNELKSKLALKA